jgi:hypothetical protein
MCFYSVVNLKEHYQIGTFPNVFFIFFGFFSDPQNWYMNLKSGYRPSLWWSCLAFYVIIRHFKKCLISSRPSKYLKNIHYLYFNNIFVLVLNYHKLPRKFFSSKFCLFLGFQYMTKKMLDGVSLFQYQACYCIVSLFHSGTGLTGYQTVWHSGISIYMYMGIDVDMQHWHGHATWTWICSIDMDMQHGHWHAARIGHAAWIWTMDMHGCRNADQKVSLASLVFR